MSVPPETNSFHVQLFSLFSTANQYNYDHCNLLLMNKATA